jgi:aminoglycoside phosphotransferase (APT) family kinase protein
VKLSENTRRWIEGATGGRVLSSGVVPGATSSLLHTIEVEMDGEVHTVILRRFTDRNWTTREPDVAVREGRSLQQAVRAGLPAPRLIAIDAHGEHCGVPATLVSLVPGRVVLDPPDVDAWLDGLAAAAAQIHRVDAAGFAWKYRRYNEAESLIVPRWTTQPEVWKTALDVVHGPQPPYRECFIHRDFHPSNVLWDGATVSGVVDWVNGCRGPAGIDVAWCRHNLANLHGVGVADHFLSCYIRQAGAEFSYEPYWDLMSVVELLPGPPRMYDGWRAAGGVNITDAVISERVDAYVASVVARL